MTFFKGSYRHWSSCSSFWFLNGNEFLRSFFSWNEISNLSIVFFFQLRFLKKSVTVGELTKLAKVCIKKGFDWKKNFWSSTKFLLKKRRGKNWNLLAIVKTSYALYTGIQATLKLAISFHEKKLPKNAIRLKNQKPERDDQWRCDPLKKVDNHQSLITIV